MPRTWHTPAREESSTCRQALCERMLYRGLLHHVSFEHGFVDGGLFYRFEVATEMTARALRRSNLHAQ